MTLSEYDFSIIWKKGKNNQNADALSRLRSPEASIQSKCRLEQVFSISKYVEDIFTEETIINCQQNDPTFQDIIKNCNLSSYHFIIIMTMLFILIKTVYILFLRNVFLAWNEHGCKSLDCRVFRV